MLRNIAICLVFIIPHVIYSCYSNTQPDFGSFAIKVSKIVMCKGPKRYDCCNNTVKLLDNGKRMLLNMDVKKDVIPNRGKIIISVNEQLLARLQIKRPCDHVFLKPLMQRMLNVTQECEIQKGIYNFEMDLEKLAMDYYGGMFFYGNLTFKNVLYNDNCNYLCILVEAVLSPKNRP